MIRVLHGDCREILPTLGVPFHACVCDPPYHLIQNGLHPRNMKIDGKGNVLKPRPAGFMNQAWDGGDIAFRPETWRMVFDVLLPGAYLVAFGGTRTYHRMVCAIEDAGFTIHPMLGWIFGVGFPKATSVGKMIDRVAGAEREVTGPGKWNHVKGANGRNGGITPDGFVSHGGTKHEETAPATPEAAQWEGWYYGLQSLKPALEPICVAQRPPERGGMVANILKYGTGALHIDACRVPAEANRCCNRQSGGDPFGEGDYESGAGRRYTSEGRWPANVLHSGDEQVEAAFAAFGTSGESPRLLNRNGDRKMDGWGLANKSTGVVHGDSGTASRYFQRCAFSPDELRFHYSSKADAADRADSRHATVKPVALLRWLVRLVTPPGGRILDPFAGSGTTGEAAMLEGFDCTLIEQDAKHVADIQHRIKRWSGGDTPLFKEAAE